MLAFHSNAGIRQGDVSSTPYPRGRASGPARSHPIEGTLPAVALLIPWRTAVGPRPTTHSHARAINPRLSRDVDHLHRRAIRRYCPTIEASRTRLKSVRNDEMPPHSELSTVRRRPRKPPAGPPCHTSAFSLRQTIPHKPPQTARTREKLAGITRPAP